MWRIFFIVHLIIVLAGINECCAETVTRKEALQVARLFFRAINKKDVTSPKLVYNGKELTTDRLFSPFYVYNCREGGFVIVAAENKAFPVLGYSADKSFDLAGLDENIRDVLRKYAKDIEIIRYDPRIPYEAVEAWSDLKGYMADIIRRGSDGAETYFNSSATEYPVGIQTDSVSPIETEEELYEPFSFHEGFVKETRSMEMENIRAMEEHLKPSEPVLRSLGGGHFEIYVPEGVSMIRIYSLSGRHEDTLFFRQTDTATVKLDSMPNGFYFLLITGGSGKSYGMKLFK